MFRDPAAIVALRCGSEVSRVTDSRSVIVTELGSVDKKKRLRFFARRSVGVPSRGGEIDIFVRTRSPLRQVAAVENEIGRRVLQVAQHGLEGRPVAMDIGDDPNLHGSNFS
jgi:hypothetical protein